MNLLLKGTTLGQLEKQLNRRFKMIDSYTAFKKYISNSVLSAQTPVVIYLTANIFHDQKITVPSNLKGIFIDGGNRFGFVATAPMDATFSVAAETNFSFINGIISSSNASYLESVIERTDSSLSTTDELQRGLVMENLTITNAKRMFKHTGNAYARMMFNNLFFMGSQVTELADTRLNACDFKNITGKFKVNMTGSGAQINNCTRNYFQNINLRDSQAFIRTENNVNLGNVFVNLETGDAPANKINIDRYNTVISPGIGSISSSFGNAVQINAQSQFASRVTRIAPAKGFTESYRGYTQTNTNQSNMAIINTVTDTAYMVEANIVGKQINNVFETNAYKIVAKGINNGGVLTVTPSSGSILWSNEDVPGWNVTIEASGTDILIRAESTINDQVDWSGTINVEVI